MSFYHDIFRAQKVNRNYLVAHEVGVVVPQRIHRVVFYSYCDRFIAFDDAAPGMVIAQAACGFSTVGLAPVEVYRERSPSGMANNIVFGRNSYIGIVLCGYNVKGAFWVWIVVFVIV